MAPVFVLLISILFVLLAMFVNYVPGDFQLVDHLYDNDYGELIHYAMGFCMSAIVAVVILAMIHAS